MNNILSYEMKCAQFSISFIKWSVAFCTLFVLVTMRLNAGLKNLFGHFRTL